eukprot:scaffold48024_cov57-Phaeocystis_antarctica.AAC.1
MAGVHDGPLSGLDCEGSRVLFGRRGSRRGRRLRAVSVQLARALLSVPELEADAPRGVLAVRIVTGVVAVRLRRLPSGVAASVELVGEPVVKVVVRRTQATLRLWG